MRIKIFTLFVSLFFALGMLGVSVNATAGCYVAPPYGYVYCNNALYNGTYVITNGYRVYPNGFRVYNGFYRGGVYYGGNGYRGGVYHGGNGYHGGVYRGGNAYRGGVYHGGNAHRADVYHGNVHRGYRR